jgi:very-short-patch-repair endonuclease
MISGMHTRKTGSPAYVRELARMNRRNTNFSERLLWARLRRRALGGFRFRRQQPLGRYIVDFCSIDGDVIVEIDGASHVGREEYDRIRDEWLDALGPTILRVSATDVESPTSREKVLSTILQTCLQNKARRASITHSP